MTNEDIKVVLELLHKRILHSKFAEEVTEAEVMALVEVINRLDSQQEKIDRLECSFGCWKISATDTINYQKGEIIRLQSLLDDKCDRCIEREIQNGIKIAFDEIGKCLVFGSSKGAYIRLAEIEKIKKNLMAEE